MGKRDPKPKFTDVTCPNEDCEDYGKVNNGNIVDNCTYDAENGKIHKFH
ncbi:MAG: helix-turn-helix domain-containing protein partial [Methanobrevibacter sp. CfCl-M3]